MDTSVVTPEVDNSYQNPKTFQSLTLWTLFVTANILAIVGNSSVIWIVLKRKDSRNLTSCFLAHNSLADLVLLCLLSIPNFYLLIFGKWPFGFDYCHLTAAFQLLASLAKLLSFWLVAFYCLCVVTKSDFQINNLQLVFSMLAIWGLALAVIYGPIVSLPPVLYVEEWREHPLFCLTYWYQKSHETFSILLQINGGLIAIFIIFVVCFRKIPLAKKALIFCATNGGTDEKVGACVLNVLFPIIYYVIIYIVIQVNFLPFFVVAFSFLLLTTVICLIFSIVFGSSKSSGDNLASSAKLKTTLWMMLVTTLVFSVCFLVRNVFLLLDFFGTINLREQPSTQSTFLAICWMDWINAMVNPIIYFAMDKQLLEGCKICFPGFCRKGNSSSVTEGDDAN